MQLLTLSEYNTACNYQAAMSTADANLYSRAIRGEENAIADFVSRALTDDGADFDQLNIIMTAMDFLVSVHPLCEPIRAVDQAL